MKGVGLSCVRFGDAYDGKLFRRGRAVYTLIIIPYDPGKNYKLHSSTAISGLNFIMGVVRLATFSAVSTHHLQPLLRRVPDISEELKTKS